MSKFLGKRGFAVVTSLALCASLVVPSFAASFTDLQNVINGNGQYTGDEITRTDDTITLNGDVINVNNENCIQIGSNINVTLDLNGHTVDYSAKDGGSAIWVNGGTLTLTDSGREDEEGNQLSGNITGGKNAGVYVQNGGSFIMNGGTISNNKGSGVHVAQNSNFTMNNGTISSNTNANGGGVIVDGKNAQFTMSGGTISRNESTTSFGGGVYVVNGGSFTMSGGAITGNTSASSGGGVAVSGQDSKFSMSYDAAITNNTTNGAGNDPGGGGVLVKSDAQFTMEGGEISGNKVTDGKGNPKGGGGGVAVHQGQFTMNDGTIRDNTSKRATGVQVNATEGRPTSYFEMSGGVVSGDGESCIYLEETTAEGHDAYFLLKDDAILNGTIHLGQGTQLITDKVIQPGGDHALSGFTVIGGGTTITPTETEADPSKDKTENGYTAGADLSLEVHYNCTPDESKWVPNGDGHNHPCKTCGKPLGETVTHTVPDAWSSWNFDSTSHTHSKTCPDCGAVVATETQPHSWSWTDSKDGQTHTRTCEVCGHTASAPHSWGDWTDNKDGTHSHACTAKGCGASVSQAHGEGGNWSDWSDTKDGANHIHSKTCPACGAVVATETGEHSWDDGVLSDDETRRIYTCLDCSANKEEPIKGSTPNPGGTTDPEDPEKPTQPETPEQPTTPEEPVTPEQPTEPEEPVTPENPDEPETPDEPAGPSDEEGPAVPSEPPEEPGDVVIDDPEIPLGPAPDLGEPDDEIELDEIELEDDVIPLSGLFTRADAIGYLWEQAGRPEAELSDFEDVPEEHQWAVAIGWAQKMGIALADEDGNFRPDDLLLRSVEDLEIDPEGEFQQFLDHYAVYADAAKPGETFLKLEGDVDDIIMGEEAQVIFDEFFLLLEEEAA